MKKLLLLMIALLTLGVSGVWADGLKVSTTESASAEYQYKIFCRNASTYYLGNTTNSTNSGTDYGLFAFFADDSGDYTNGYYIYSIFEGKWLSYTAKESYTDSDEGKNKITLTTEKPTVPWHIAADNADNKYYDIRAFKTDKTLDDSGYASWNWHGGVANNTSNTMGFYRYNDNNSGWGIVLAGGSGSPVADRKIVALYNVPNDNNQYALYNSNGTPKVYNSTTGVTPQYFVLIQNGLDTNGEALYRLQKAEADGKFLNYQTFGDGLNYMFLNTSSSFYNNFTITTSNNPSPAVSPYFNLYRVYPNATDNNSRPYANQVAQCSDAVVNMFSGASDNLPAQLTAKGNWNGRWQVVEQTYSAWQVIMSGATSGTITYGGSALISGGTATQSNNGIFVLNATPTASDFTASVVDGYFTDPTITIDSDRKIIKIAYTSYQEIYNTITTTLADAPEGVGYPTATARTRMQAAIDVFDASSKVTADLTTLNTAYNSFLTSVVLPEGKVYTIQSYVKSPSSKTAYLENIDGTLTISSDASATALNNLWVVRKSGNDYVLQSAADPTKYLTYEADGISTTAATWTFSKGTEWPYLALYNSTMGGGRYLGCDASGELGKFGTNGTNYWAQNPAQASGWSTDFKFVESDDYALYKVRIIYPSGSTPTVTYNETAYYNGSDFVAPTSLTTSDLTVSEVSGYTPTITIDGDIVYVDYKMAVGVSYVDTWNYDSYPWLLLNDAPTGIDNSRTYRYNTKRINIVATHNSSLKVTFAYSSGNSRIDVAGVDLINPSTGDVVKGDYHDGYSGYYQSNQEYAISDVAPGTYILRYISFGGSTSSVGNISANIVPSQGYYRLKNVATDKYLSSKATGAWNSSTRGVYANGNNTDASTVIRLFDKDSDGSLYMYNQGYGFGWTATNVGGGVAWITSSPDKYINWFPGNTDGQVAFAICYGNGTGDYASYLEKGIYTVDTSDDAVIAGTDYTDDKAQWVIEAATYVTIPLNSVTSAGGSYATICFPFDVTLETPGPTSGAIPYVVTIDGSRARLNSFGSMNIPAGTPVLLAGALATKSVTATITSGLSEFTGDNDLEGTYFDKTSLGDNEYIFATKDGEIGFWKMKSGNKLGANKAYLVYDGDPSEVKGFTIEWGDITDGIRSIDNEQLTTGNEIYNLSGQRLSRLQKGINIVNGKKIIVK